MTERAAERVGEQSGEGEIAIGVYALFAGPGAAAGLLWDDGRQAILAAGFAAGALVSAVRPEIERRRRLSFAVPPGGAELAALPVACGACIVVVRLAQG